MANDSTQTSSAPPTARQTETVGLVVDEGVPAGVAATLVNQLAGRQAQVQVTIDRIPLDDNGGIPMVELARRYRSDNEWAIVVLITDLPMRLGTTPLVADYNTKHRVALLSLPALGAVQLANRLCGLAVPLIQHLAEPDAGTLSALLRSTKRIGSFRVPIRHVPSDSPKGDQYLALAGYGGRLQMLFGMVRSNRPWRLVPSLERATAAAAATAAFPMFYSGLWPMADMLHPARLALISVLAIGAMVTWFICYNRLWERPSGHRQRGEAVLFNASTVITLGIGVAVMYMVLFTVTMVVAVTVIDSRYLQSQLGHPAGLDAYVRIVWLACSMGIIAGALGSSFDSEEAVRHAAYSRRERERQARQRQRDDRADQIT